MTNLNKKNVLINFLTIMGCIISIGSISIFTIFQAKAEDENPILQSNIKYSGIDNKAGVLKNIDFSKSGNITEIVNSFYMKNNNIILKNLNIIIPALETSGNAILGGTYNTTTSPNTTIIGGSYITSSGENTAFGGEGNTIEGEGNAIGGQDNRIIGNNTIIGGNSNTATGNNNIIIGGQDINVGGNNIIAAGEKINISDNNSDNSFIFNNSNTTFTPETPNTFYINSQGGLGINGEGSEDATVIHGGILIGEIDFNNGCTDTKDIGIMGTQHDCLLACTEFSLNEGWSLIENTQRCVDWCKENDRCIDPPVIPDIEQESFSGYCTGTIFTGSTPCFSSLYPQKYNNVIFTYNYVNKCPNSQEELNNPCTYKCPEGYSFGDGTCKKNCEITGDNNEKIIVPHGESINLYLEKAPYCAHNCKSETRTCNDGNLSSTHAQFRYLSCQIQIKTENQCDENEYNIEENEKIAGGKYTACTGYTINGNSCSIHVKYKLQTCDTGYTLSGGICHKDCIFNGKTVHYGQTTTGYKYKTSNCPNTQNKCNISKILKCGEGGSFGNDGLEYQYTGCKLIGESCSGFNISSCPSHGICSSCTGYNLNNNSCNQFIKYRLESCMTGYTKVGDTCKSDCQLPRGGSIPNGFTTTGYKNSTQYCPDGCEVGSNKKIMTCNDGVLDGSGTYIYSGCTTNVLSGQGFNRYTKVDNAICETLTGYTIRNNKCIAGTPKYKCTACKSGYTRNGNNWNGSNVKCLKDCSFTALPSNETVYLSGNGGTIRTYNTGLFICPTIANNNSQIRTCNNGILDGSFEYTRYTQTGASCVIQNTSEIKTFTNKINNEGGNNLKMIKSCWGSAFNGNSCSEETTYYTYECNPGYIRANNNSKCIKCEGNIPDHAHSNNSTPSGNKSIEYSYNTDTSVACTFSCDSGFTRNSNTNQCVSNNNKCYLDGDEYIEGTFTTIYENNKPICYNTCNQIKVECKNGSWRDYENYRTITGNVYSSCSTTTGHTSNNGELQEGKCNISSNTSNNRVFSGTKIPSYITGAYPTSTCIEYRNNGSGCKTAYNYKNFYCPTSWSGDTCTLSCKRKNQYYNNGSGLKVYDRQGEVVCPDSGHFQYLKCMTGVRYISGTDAIKDFNDGFNYDGSEYNLQANTCEGYPYTKTNEIPTGSYFGSCTIYGVTSDKTCSAATTRYKVLECPEGFTNFSGECKQDCTIIGRNGSEEKVVYGQSTTGYESYTAICPNTCSPQRITCSSGGNFNYTGYKYNYCLGVQKTCSSSYIYKMTDPIPEGSNIEICTGYTFTNKSCNLDIRYKISKCQSGYTRIESKKECKKNCSIGSVEFPYGQTFTFYLPTPCPGPSLTKLVSCEEGGRLSGWNYIGSPTETLYSTTTCTSDYNLPSCPTKGICQTCTGYTLINNNECSAPSNKYKLTNCIQPRTLEGGSCKAACSLPRGGLIKHNESIEARKFENGQCKHITRICNNGQLSNSGYDLEDCLANICITPRGEQIPSGESATGYKETRCTSTNTKCNGTSVTRTCINGERYLGNNKSNFPEDYKYSYCKIIDGESPGCTDEHNTKYSERQAGGIYTGGCRKYQYNGSACVGDNFYKLIGCESGYKLIGDKCYKGCTGFGNYYEHQSELKLYSTPVYCSSTTTECPSQYRICDDGNRRNTEDGSIDKDFPSNLSLTCTKLANVCSSSYPLTSASSNSHCQYESCILYEAGSCRDSGNRKYGLQYVETGYYAKGSTCNTICGDGYSTACNEGYTATGFARQLPNSNIRVTNRGHQYTCNKSDNTIKGADSYTCNCDFGWWNGLNCKVQNSNLCTTIINQCNSSYLISGNVIDGGYSWTCGIENYSETCIKCNENEGYKPNSTKTGCEKEPEPQNPCGGTKPTGQGVITGPSSIISFNGSIYGYTSWTYINDPNSAGSLGCAWSCQKGYKPNSAGNGCEKICGNSCEGTKPTGQGVVLGSSTIACNNGYIQGYTGWSYIDNPDYLGSACCSRSCQPGYKLNTAKNGCIEDFECGYIERKSPLMYRDIRYFPNDRNTGNACSGGFLIPNPIVVGRDGCSSPKAKRQCSNGEEIKECRTSLSVLPINLTYIESSKGGGPMGSIKITQGFGCINGNSACADARNIHLRVTYTEQGDGEKTCDFQISTENKSELIYDIVTEVDTSNTYGNPNLRTVKCEGATSYQNSVKKVEIISDETYSSTQQLNINYDTIFILNYSNASPSCNATTRSIYPFNSNHS